jgi:hypothetical protein
MKQCPACAEMIEDTATRCPYCRSDVTRAGDAEGARRSPRGLTVGVIVAMALCALLVVGALLAAILLWPGSGGDSDAATYREIAEIYQQHKSGSGDDLEDRASRISDRLSETADTSKRAQQEMLWATRDYLLPMLGSPPGSDIPDEEGFKTHMAVARQLIDDPSLPDLGGSIPEPESESE